MAAEIPDRQTRKNKYCGHCVGEVHMSQLNKSIVQAKKPDLLNLNHTRYHTQMMPNYFTVWEFTSLGFLDGLSHSKWKQPI